MFLVGPAPPSLVGKWSILGFLSHEKKCQPHYFSLCQFCVRIMWLCTCHTTNSTLQISKFAFGKAWLLGRWKTDRHSKRGYKWFNHMQLNNSQQSLFGCLRSSLAPCPKSQIINLQNWLLKSMFTYRSHPSNLLRELQFSSCFKHHFWPLFVRSLPMPFYYFYFLYAISWLHYKIGPDNRNGLQKCNGR